MVMILYLAFVEHTIVGQSILPHGVPAATWKDRQCLLVLPPQAIVAVKIRFNPWPLYNETDRLLGAGPWLPDTSPK
jgi:hypothetical protein